MCTCMLYGGHIGGIFVDSKFVCVIYLEIKLQHCMLYGLLEMSTFNVPVSWMHYHTMLLCNVQFLSQMAYSKD